MVLGLFLVFSIDRTPKQNILRNNSVICFNSCKRSGATKNRKSSSCNLCKMSRIKKNCNKLNALIC